MGHSKGNTILLNNRFTNLLLKLEQDLKKLKR
jgi:hypothetical protein